MCQTPAPGAAKQGARQGGAPWGAACGAPRKRSQPTGATHLPKPPHWQVELAARPRRVGAGPPPAPGGAEQKTAPHRPAARAAHVDFILVLAHEDMERGGKAQHYQDHESEVGSDRGDRIPHCGRAREEGGGRGWGGSHPRPGAGASMSARGLWLPSAARAPVSRKAKRVLLNTRLKYCDTEVLRLELRPPCSGSAGRPPPGGGTAARCTEWRRGWRSSRCARCA